MYAASRGGLSIAGAGLGWLQQKQARGSVGCDGNRRAAQSAATGTGVQATCRNGMHIENIGCDVMIPRSSITIGCGEDRDQFRAQSRLSGP